MSKKVRVLITEEKSKAKWVNDCCEDRLYIPETPCKCKENVGKSATINATSIEKAIETTKFLDWTSINTTDEQYIYKNADDASKICLKGAGRYRVGYYANFKHKETEIKEIRINLVANDQVIFTFYNPDIPPNKEFTQTISAIIAVPESGTCLQLQNANGFPIFHQLTAGDIQKVE